VLVQVQPVHVELAVPLPLQSDGLHLLHLDPSVPSTHPGLQVHEEQVVVLVTVPWPQFNWHESQRVPPQGALQLQPVQLEYFEPPLRHEKLQSVHVVPVKLPVQLQVHVGYATIDPPFLQYDDAHALQLVPAKPSSQLHVAQF